MLQKASRSASLCQVLKAQNFPPLPAHWAITRFSIFVLRSWEVLGLDRAWSRHSVSRFEKNFRKFFYALGNAIACDRSALESGANILRVSDEAKQKAKLYKITMSSNKRALSWQKHGETSAKRDGWKRVTKLNFSSRTCWVDGGGLSLALVARVATMTAHSMAKFSDGMRESSSHRRGIVWAFLI